MKKGKIITVVASCLLICTLLLSACGTQAQGNGAESAGEDPSVKASDAAILVVSFGTSFNESRDRTIGAIEKAIQEAYPDIEVRRAFTSQIIIDKLRERDGLEIDNVTQALDRAVADGIRTLIVQPTHLMNGFEYTDLADELEKYRDSFDQVVIGQPLLSSEDDFKAVSAAITAATAEYDNDTTAVCFMGHGTEADSNAVYPKMQEVLNADGHDNYFIGTVEAEPSLDDVISQLRGSNCTRVVLEPLMVVAGDHANNDMAGDEDDSWKVILQNEGYEVECILRGLGELEDIQKIYVEHVSDAMASLE